MPTKPYIDSPPIDGTIRDSLERELDELVDAVDDEDAEFWTAPIEGPSEEERRQLTEAIVVWSEPTGLEPSATEPASTIEVTKPTLSAPERCSWPIARRPGEANSPGGTSRPTSTTAHSCCTSTESPTGQPSTPTPTRGSLWGGLWDHFQHCCGRNPSVAETRSRTLGNFVFATATVLSIYGLQERAMDPMGPALLEQSMNASSQRTASRSSNASEAEVSSLETPSEFIVELGGGTPPSTPEQPRRFVAGDRITIDVMMDEPLPAGNQIYMHATNTAGQTWPLGRLPDRFIRSQGRHRRSYDAAVSELLPLRDGAWSFHLAIGHDRAAATTTNCDCALSTHPVVLDHLAMPRPRDHHRPREPDREP